jgi:hypothetical protein
VFSEGSRRIGLLQIPLEGIGKVKMGFSLLWIAQNMAKLAVQSLPVFILRFSSCLVGTKRGWLVLLFSQPLRNQLFITIRGYRVPISKNVNTPSGYGLLFGPTPAG